MIELNQFISESLKQLIDGISEAQEYGKDKGAMINPEYISGGGSEAIYRQVAGKNRDFVNFIDFDISVITKESKEGEGGAGIFVTPITFGGKVKSDETQTNQSRLKFSVPVI